MKGLKFSLTCLVIVVLLIGLNGCGEEPQSSQSSEQATRTQVLGDDTYEDKNGWTWHKIGTVDEYVSESVAEEDQVDDPVEKPSIGEMSVSEVAEKYRPLLEFERDVYRLSEEDTLTFAEEMKESFSEGVTPTSGTAEPYDENTSTSALSTVEQRMVIGDDDRHSLWWADEVGPKS